MPQSADLLQGPSPRRAIMKALRRQSPPLRSPIGRPARAYPLQRRCHRAPSVPRRPGQAYRPVGVQESVHRFRSRPAGRPRLRQPEHRPLAAGGRRFLREWTGRSGADFGFRIADCGFKKRGSDTSSIRNPKSEIRNRPAAGCWSTLAAALPADALPPYYEMFDRRSFDPAHQRGGGPGPVADAASCRPARPRGPAPTPAGWRQAWAVP